MRAIKRMSIYEPIVRLLAEREHPVTGKAMFPTMRELLCFAATLGFSEGKRSALVGDTLEIDGRIFENSPQAIDMLYLIALADAASADILQGDREDEMVRVFEEYAATGFSVLDTWLKERAEDVYGDQALISAFRKYGYLDGTESKPFDPGAVAF